MIVEQASKQASYGKTLLSYLKSSKVIEVLDYDIEVTLIPYEEVPTTPPVKKTKKKGTNAAKGKGKGKKIESSLLKESSKEKVINIEDTVYSSKDEPVPQENLPELTFDDLEETEKGSR